MQSCQYFETKDKKEIMLKKALQNINWNDVDEYPSIGNCDILDDKQQQKQCFFEYLNQNIQKKIDSITVQKTFKTNDSVKLKIMVLPNSKIVYSYNSAQLNSIQNVKLDSVLKLPEMQFKHLKPALKRGIPVKIQFEMSILFQLN